MKMVVAVLAVSTMFVIASCDDSDSSSDDDSYSRNGSSASIDPEVWTGDHSIEEMAFIQTVHDNIPATVGFEDSTLIKLGNDACDAMGMMTDESDLYTFATYMVEGAQGTMSMEDAGSILGAAAGSMCPQYMSLVQ